MPSCLGLLIAVILRRFVSDVLKQQHIPVVGSLMQALLSLAVRLCARLTTFAIYFVIFLNKEGMVMLPRVVQGALMRIQLLLNIFSN